MRHLITTFFSPFTLNLTSEDIRLDLDFGRD